MGDVTLNFPDTLSLDAGSEPGPGPIEIGSEAHKILFCRTLLTTFDPYRPAIIDWPKLSAETQARINALPIWDIAVQTEGKAGLRVATFGKHISDPLLRRAIALDAFEESRHKHVLHNMVQAYGITLEPEPVYQVPQDPEWAFLVTGYSECIDSFFGFGLFELAKRSGFFPKELVDTFEPVMKEESRHILFFVNWAAWHRHNLSFWQRLRFDLKVMAVWVFLGWERIGMVRDVGGGKPQDNNFTVNGAKEMGVDVSIAELFDLCLAENERRLGAYDPRLLRPVFTPALVRLVRRFMGKPKPAVA